jgi:hypothetical protein
MYSARTTAAFAGNGAPAVVAFWLALRPDLLSRSSSALVVVL